MKKLLGIVVLSLLWCSIGVASGLPRVFDLNTCLSQEAYGKIKVDTAIGMVVYDATASGSGVRMAGAFKIKNISKEGIITTDRLIYGELLQKGDRGKWWNISLRNTLAYLVIDPKNKKFDKISEVRNTPDKKILKSFKKTWGASEGVIGKDSYSCETYFAYKEPKEQKPKKEIDIDDNKIVPASSGTGFFVSREGHIITNNHVVDQCNAVKIGYDGKNIEGKILAADRMNDLAIIKTNIRPTKVFAVSASDASLLEDVIIAGYPLGKEVSAAIKTSKGSITALAGYGDNYSEFQTDAALNQGNSGGPIINLKGNVIGVAVANFGKAEGVESFNFGIKSSTLRTFANANGLRFQPPNRRALSNKDLGELITNATIYIECWMTVAKIKRLIAEAENRKAFFSEYQ